VLHCAPVSRSKCTVTSSHRLLSAYVSSLPHLHSGNKMLYLCDYTRAEACRVGRTYRRPHCLSYIISLSMAAGKRSMQACSILFITTNATKIKKYSKQTQNIETHKILTHEQRCRSSEKDAENVKIKGKPVNSHR